LVGLEGVFLGALPRNQEVCMVYNVNVKTDVEDRNGDKKTKYIYVSAASLVEAANKVFARYPNFEITAIYHESDEFIA